MTQVNDNTTSFFNQITVRGVIASLISLGLIEEEDPPRVSICFHDVEVTNKDNVITKCNAHYSVSISEDDFCNSSLHSFTARMGNDRQFFDTCLTFNDVLDMHVQSVVVSRGECTWSETPFKVCSIILSIPGLFKKINPTYKLGGK